MSDESDQNASESEGSSQRRVNRSHVVFTGTVITPIGSTTAPAATDQNIGGQPSRQPSSRDGQAGESQGYSIGTWRLEVHSEAPSNSHRGSDNIQDGPTNDQREAPNVQTATRRAQTPSAHRTPTHSPTHCDFNTELRTARTRPSDIHRGGSNAQHGAQSTMSPPTTTTPPQRGYDTELRTPRTAPSATQSQNQHSVGIRSRSGQQQVGENPRASSSGQRSGIAAPPNSPRAPQRNRQRTDRGLETARGYRLHIASNGTRYWVRRH